MADKLMGATGPLGRPSLQRPKNFHHQSFLTITPTYLYFPPLHSTQFGLSYTLTLIITFHPNTRKTCLRHSPAQTTPNNCPYIPPLLHNQHTNMCVVMQLKSKKMQKPHKGAHKKAGKKVHKTQKRSLAFRASKASRAGYFATPQPDFQYDDTPAPAGYAYRYSYTPEPDFWKDGPTKSLAGKLMQKFQNRWLIQTGNPQFFDRDYEQQKALGEKEFAQMKRNLLANHYGNHQGYDELDFNTSYYKRVGLFPKLEVGGQEDDSLVMDPKLSLWRESPNHLVRYHNHYQPQYLDHREHTVAATGVINQGPEYVPRTTFEFPIASADSDYLYFHH